jgi:hypothetical protein
MLSWPASCREQRPKGRVSTPLHGGLLAMGGKEDSESKDLEYNKKRKA